MLNAISTSFGHILSSLTWMFIGPSRAEMLTSAISASLGHILSSLTWMAWPNFENNGVFGTLCGEPGCLSDVTSEVFCGSSWFIG